MGEERSEPNPFLFFVSHTDQELIKAVRKGRKAEFADFHAHGEAPDPQAIETFERSKLNWDMIDQEPHQTMLRYYKALIGLRKHQPALKSPDRKNMSVEVDTVNNTLILQRWTDEQSIICLLNFANTNQNVMIPEGVDQWQKLFDSAGPGWNGPVSSPQIISTGVMAIPPESILIYTQYYA
jgi:maltooligosyltrehalose trehalohydrolase